MRIFFILNMVLNANASDPVNVASIACFEGLDNLPLAMSKLGSAELWADGTIGMDYSEESKSVRKTGVQWQRQLGAVVYTNDGIYFAPEPKSGEKFRLSVPGLDPSTDECIDISYSKDKKTKFYNIGLCKDPDLLHAPAKKSARGEDYKKVVATDVIDPDLRLLLKNELLRRINRMGATLKDFLDDQDKELAKRKAQAQKENKPFQSSGFDENFYKKYAIEKNLKAIEACEDVKDPDVKSAVLKAKIAVEAINNGYKAAGGGGKKGAAEAEAPR